MASPSVPVHPARYLAVFLALLILVYLAVFLTGDKQLKPKLGIDLQGGTRVTLTARTPDGGKPSRTALEQAQQIIDTRVNGLGVSGSEVVIDGDNLIITVPGNDGDQARTLGQTARLYVRPVIESMPAEAAPAPGQQLPGQQVPPGMPMPGQRYPGQPVPGQRYPGQPQPGLPVPGVPVPGQQQPDVQQPGQQQPDVQQPGQPQPGQPQPGGPVPGQQQPENPLFPDTGGQLVEPQPRPYPQEPTPPAPEPEPAPPVNVQPPDNGQARAERVKKEKELRQSTNKGVQYVVLQLEARRCATEKEDVLAGNDDPALPLITCSTDHKRAYLLGPSIISGDQIADANSGMNQQKGGYVVELRFTGDATDIWGDYTAAHIGGQAAFTLDSQVVSAPTINEAIRGGRTEISGNFTQREAKDLAGVLKYGSLPLSFEASEAETVSASLGLTSLRAGLIAGAIGLALVLLYSLVYYRVLGVLTALSLVASGAMVYAILVLLGRYINYTLDLAGIAGLIIGIGTTADSFVVFFERIKDEIREGRSFRSAVPRGWARARKTIVSGNAVTFLAAAVLYFLAIGQVKGFAFTLGLTTILDLVVVFLVTWPLVYLASKSPTLARPAFNGLGAVQQVARERRAMAGSKAVSAGRG